MMAVLVWLCWRRSWSLTLAAGLAAFAFIGLWQLLLIRPQTFSKVLFVALYAVLELSLTRGSWLILAPLILALWANLHGGFPMGLMLVGCYLIAAGWEARWTRGRSWWRDGRLQMLAPVPDGLRAGDPGESLRLAHLPVRFAHLGRGGGAAHRRMGAAGAQLAGEQGVGRLGAGADRAVRSSSPAADSARGLPGAVLPAAGVRLGVDGSLVAARRHANRRGSTRRRRAAAVPRRRGWGAGNNGDCSDLRAVRRRLCV